MKQSLLILSFLFYACFASAQVFPSTLSGLSLWLSADSVDLNSGKVSTWYDRSVNNILVTQPDSNKQPVYSPINSQMNNQPSILFDGVDDYLKGPFSSTLSTDSITLFFVQKTIPLSNFSGSLVFVNNINSTDNNSPDNLIAFLDISGTMNAYRNNNAVLYQNNFITNPTIYQITTDGTTLRTYLNNVFANAIVSVGAFAFDNAIVGTRWNTAPTLPMNCDMFEIILYNRLLTLIEQSQIIQYLYNKYAPPVNLGPDIIISYGFCDTTLDAEIRFTNFLWLTGDTTQTITVGNTGNYWVEATDIFGRLSRDTIQVTYPGNLAPFSSSQTICYGDSLVWDTQLDTTGYDFLWQDGSTDSLFKITQSGQYYVQVTDTLGCSFFSDTITVTIDTFALVASLGDDTAVCSGNYIELQQGVSQTISYLWSDGTDSSVMQIDSTGAYWVTVTDSLGCTASDTINIFIKGMASVTGFTATAACLGGNTMFADTSSTPDSANIISWLWDFGDSITDTLQNPTHFYVSAGNYNVTLTVVTDSGCSANAVKAVDVHVLPEPNFSPVLGCSGAGVSFTDLSSVPLGSLTGWEWDFGDSDTSTMQNPTHIFADSGNYYVKLKVFTNNGCIDSLTQTVTIKLSPIAGFSHPPACDGEYVTFTDISTTTFPWSITGWIWDFGDSYTSTLPNPVHLYADTGMYNVSLIVQALDGCVDTVVNTVIVNPSPVANFTGSDLCLNTPHQFIDSSYITAGIITSWYWDFGGSGASTDQNPLFAFSDTGSHPVSLTVASSAGCNNSITDTVEVRELPAVDFSFTPTFGTPPLTVSFTNQSTGASSYSWDFGDPPAGGSTAQNPTHLYADTGIYQIELDAFDIYGCRDSIVKTIKVIRTILDIAVIDVVTNLQSNYLTVSANLFNSGTRDINSLELHTQINGGTAIREDWTDTLLSGQKTTYDFTAGFVLPVNFDLQYVCISALNPNKDNDDVPSNNEQCVIFSEGFVALEPYPNPTDNEINIEYIIPYSEFVEVVLYDAIGKKVAVLFSDKAQKGLNKLLVNSAILNSGMYFYEISFIDKTEVKKFVVSQ